MHEILGEVWEPFKTAAGAIRGLETDAAPWLELEFWDSLAEAFLRYFGKTITLQVDTAGLLRAEKARAGVLAREASNEDVLDTLDNQGKQDESSGKELEGRVGEAQGEAISDPSTKKVEMLPLGSVGHLGRADRMGIIRKTVPKERRVAVLQRLFQLAQAPSEDVERLVTTVKELKNNASPSEIRDVNLLETWQGVREERTVAWDNAIEQVRLAAADAARAPPVEAKDGDDVVMSRDSANPTKGSDTYSGEPMSEHSGDLP
ncbi:unnamed protein product [Scytosiphon promiscuus]